MTISIPKDLEARLQDQAKRSGMDTDSYVTSLLARAVVSSSSAGSLAELFAQQEKEQWTDDPTEISRRTREEAEFMEAMIRNRQEMEGRNARKLYP